MRYLVNFHTLCDRPLVWLAPFTSLIDPPNTTFYCPSCPSRACISGTSSVATRRRHLKYLFQIGNWDRKKKFEWGEDHVYPINKIFFSRVIRMGAFVASAGFFVLGIRFCFWDDEWWSTFGRRRLRLVLCFLLNQPGQQQICFTTALKGPKVVWGWVRILPPRIIYKQVFYRWWCERSFIKFTAL